MARQHNDCWSTSNAADAAVAAAERIMMTLTIGQHCRIIWTSSSRQRYFTRASDFPASLDADAADVIDRVLLFTVLVNFTDLDYTMYDCLKTL